MKRSFVLVVFTVIIASCTELQFVPVAELTEAVGNENRNENPELSCIRLLSDKREYAAGDMAAFIAEAIFSDGKTIDITEQCYWESCEGCQRTTVPGTFLVNGSDGREALEIACNYIYDGKSYSDVQSYAIYQIEEGIEASTVTSECTKGELTLTIHDPELKGWKITTDDNFLLLDSESTGKGNAIVIAEYDADSINDECSIFVTIGQDQYKRSIRRVEVPDTEMSVDYWCHAELSDTESIGWENYVPGGKATVSIYFELSERALTDMTVRDNLGNCYSIKRGEFRSSVANLYFDYVKYRDLTPGSIYSESIMPSQVTFHNEDQEIIRYRYSFDF